MSDLQLTARFKIHDGKIDQFRELEKSCIQTVKDQDKGTIQYDWFYTPDGKECVVRERYRDSDALLEHLGNVGPYLGQLLEIAKFSAELCGDPSEALVDAIAPFEVTTYGYSAGLD